MSDAYCVIVKISEFLKNSEIWRDPQMGET